MGISNVPATGLGASGNMIMTLLFACATIGLSFLHQSILDGLRLPRGRRGRGRGRPPSGSIRAPTSWPRLQSGTALAGLAGAMYTFFTQFITADAFDFIFSVMLMAMVVIGGIGSTWGVVVAAVGLTLLPEAIRFVNDYRLLVFGGLLVLVIRSGAWRPGGHDAWRLAASKANMSAALQLDDVAIRFGGVAGGPRACRLAVATVTSSGLDRTEWRRQKQR